MGTTFSVVLYGPERVILERTAREVLDEAHRLDAQLSNYKSTSEISRVNALASREPVRVSDELFDLIAASLDYSHKSAGAFDVTVGPLMKTWGFYKGDGELPASDEIARVLPRVGYQHVVLDATSRTVSFDRAGVEIDFGGIGKGYAVDRMRERISRTDIASAFISAGGSSLYGMGAPPDEPRGWHVAIRDPRNPNETAAEVFLENTSLSTSGTAEKFFRAQGRVYSHLMDPRTGYPAQGILSVSVVAPRTIDSEVWAKPFFINGPSWTAKHLPAGYRVLFCEQAKPSCSWMSR
jgi:thiamine biosynthesis lipoprotein